jgi:hypothetical protein
MIKNRVLQFYFIIFFCLSSVLFFYPSFIDLSLLYYLNYALSLLIFLTVIVTYRGSDNNVFFTPIFLLLIAIFISGISATYSWGQDILSSVKALTVGLSYIFFFLLLNWKMHTKDLEKVILINGVIYILVFSVTFLLYPIPIFGGNQQYSDDRGFQRIMLIGFGFLFLFSFYSLSKYLKKRQLLWFIIFLITVIFIIMLLTRQLIISSFIFLTAYILRKSSFSKRIIAILLIACFVYIVTQMSFYKLLVEQTKAQTENVEDDIRVLSALFYLNDFSPDNFTRIFGNGEPSGGSSYYRHYSFIEKGLGLYQSDVGYIGLYSKFGILAILAYLIVIFRTIKVSVPEEYLYCKYFLYFVFVSSILGSCTFSRDFIIPIVLALYIISSNNLSHSNIDEPSKSASLGKI